MSVICQHCHSKVETDSATTCPHCQRPLDRTGDPTLLGVLSPASAQATPPAPSSIAVDDAAMLRSGSMHPPTRLGSLGRMGKFEIVKALGQGGMGRVFLATEPITGASVALKALLPELAQDPRVVKCFLAEARHMYELSHPNILKVLEVSGADEGAFLVMPLVRGGSLDQRIGGHPLETEDVIAIAMQVAEGLSYAHSKGLIHRDLKPGNILLDDQGRAMISDFGLVRPFFSDSLVDVDRARPEGTPAYMSPRVAAGLAEDTRADIYAFGALMYEMICGHPPYEGRDPMGVIQSVIGGPPSRLAVRQPKAPTGLVAVAEWCMARELRDRYASMNDVLEDLKRLDCGQPPHGPHGSAPARRSTRTIVIVLASTVILAILIGIGFMTARRGTDQTARVDHAVATTDDLLLEADALRARGELDAAELRYEALLVTKPTHARALFGMGVIELSRGRHRDATSHLRRAIESSPSDPEIAKTLAMQLIEIGHLEPARFVLENWLKADPSNQDARQLLKQLDQTTAGDSDARRRPEPPEGSRRPPPVRGPLGREPPLGEDPMQEGRRPPPRGLH